MKHNLFLSMLAAALLGSGVANADTLYASQYNTDQIVLATGERYDKLVVDTPLTLTGENGFLDLYDGASIEFQKEQAAESICSIFTSAERVAETVSVFFNQNGAVYNFTFDEGAQGIVAASAGTPITLIEDLNKESFGFGLWGSPTTLTLNGKVAGESVEMGGVQFTYVGPQSSDYTFQEGQIGFTGYYQGSHALSLVVGGSPTPEPATGTLGLLALAALSARRRKK